LCGLQGVVCILATFRGQVPQKGCIKLVCVLCVEQMVYLQGVQ